MFILDLHVRLRILALLAENEFVDETIKMVLKLGRLVGAIDDPAVIGGIVVGLRAKFKPEIFDDIYSRSQFQGEILIREVNDIQAGGRAKDWATLLRLTMTVLIPFPLPSILDCRRSIL